MKKYINLMLGLSFAGIAVTSVLLYQHYHPDLDMGLISCGKGFKNPCIAVGQSEYAVLFGVPLAAIGLIFYIFVTFMLLVADYTKEKYYAIINGAVLPVIALSVAGDAVLSLILVKLGSLCSLCVATYAINIALLAAALLMIRQSSSFAEIISSVKTLFSPQNSDQRAVLALLILFVFFLGFSVISASNVLRMKAGQNAPSEKFIAKELASFYAKPVIDIDFPESNMVVGSKNPKVKIYIFNDFLCSACYKFYNVEKYILARYGDRVQIVYYHYPLDRTCNRYFDDTLYAGSCMASKSMHAAASAGFFEEYFFIHFSRYKEIKDNFEEKTVSALVKETADEFGIDDARIKKFNEVFDSAPYAGSITSNIEFAERMKINATPTIYINGRELNGTPPKEVLEAIILTELSKNKR